MYLNINATDAKVAFSKVKKTITITLRRDGDHSHKVVINVVNRATMRIDNSTALHALDDDAFNILKEDWKQSKLRRVIIMDKLSCFGNNDLLTDEDYMHCYNAVVVILQCEDKIWTISSKLQQFTRYLARGTEKTNLWNRYTLIEPTYDDEYLYSPKDIFRVRVVSCSGLATSVGSLTSLGQYYTEEFARQVRVDDCSKNVMKYINDFVCATAFGGYDTLLTKISVASQMFAMQSMWNLMYGYEFVHMLKDAFRRGSIVVLPDAKDYDRHRIFWQDTDGVLYNVYGRTTVQQLTQFGNKEILMEGTHKTVDKYFNYMFKRQATRLDFVDKAHVNKLLSDCRRAGQIQKLLSPTEELLSM